MLREELDQYRARLRAMAGRVGETAGSLEDVARGSGGGEPSGGISNAPLHLADLGTDAYLQELNATLLENETYILDEVAAALARIEDGTFGRCVQCAAPIPPERLDALPYTPYCVGCAAALNTGVPVNLNAGRPDVMAAAPLPSGDASPRDATGRTSRGDHADHHAAGTAGGGTAVGGLAGTNVGDGDPDNADLQRAAGSGSFDVEIEADEEGGAYSGNSGGAVGGTPANKRATGGKKRGGSSPES